MAVSSNGTAETAAPVVKVISSKKPDEERARLILLEIKGSRAEGVHKRTIKGIVSTLGGCSPFKVAKVLLREMTKCSAESSLGCETSLPISSASRPVSPSEMVRRLEMALSILMAMSRETVQLAFTEMPPPSLAGAGENRARKIRAWKRPLKAAKIPGYLHVQEVLDCLQRQLRASWGALLIGSGASTDVPLFTRAML